MLSCDFLSSTTSALLSSPSRPIELFDRALLAPALYLLLPSLVVFSAELELDSDDSEMDRDGSLLVKASLPSSISFK